MQIRGKMRLQSVLVLEPSAAKDAVEFRFLSAKAEMRVHGRFSRVDLAAHSARVNIFWSGLTWNTNDESCVDAESVDASLKLDNRRHPNNRPRQTFLAWEIFFFFLVNSLLVARINDSFHLFATRLSNVQVFPLHKAKRNILCYIYILCERYSAWTDIKFSSNYRNESKEILA